MSARHILVTGGAGFIGSHMAHMLHREGYVPVILDDLSSGNRASVANMPFFVGDIADDALIRQIHREYPFVAVIHFAGFIQVGESVKNPQKYYQNNVAATLSLLTTLNALQVKRVVFSSSASIYGEPQSFAPVTEDHPKSPLNSYGRSKLIVEHMLNDFQTAYGFQVVCLRYFNVAGADASVSVSARTTPSTNNLLPIALHAMAYHQPIHIFGNDYPTQDGTCIRDYIHVTDICRAHLDALTFLLEKPHDEAPFAALNLGTSHGASVLTVINTIEAVVGRKAKLIFTERRPGDPAFLVAAGAKAKAVLGWAPLSSTLPRIVEDAWRVEMIRFNQQADVVA